MAHTQTQTDVKLRLGLIEQLGLGDGVAHGLPYQLFLEGRTLHMVVGGGQGLLGKAGLPLGDAAGLAAHGHHLEPLLAQDALYNGGLLVQAHAEAHPQSGIAHTVGKLCHLPQAGPLAIAQRLDGGAGQEEVVVLRLGVFLQDVVKEVIVPHRAVLGHLFLVSGLACGDGTASAGKHNLFSSPVPYVFFLPLLTEGAENRFIRPPGQSDRPPARPDTGRRRGHPESQ